jgi:XTP/dITP diphosphohydrolase|tara:strand:- start:4291 stop:4887 length:597 start_codon:yes stop_codon:yes gene_type:complete
MNKIKEILIGTNNIGKYKEICDLLPKKLIKYSPKKFNIFTPEETGKSFEENSMLKASYFAKKTNLICLSDDSGLEVDLLGDRPGIYSARWSGPNNDFNLAIKRVFNEMTKTKKNWLNDNAAKFICCLTLYLPGGKYYTSRGVVEGKISKTKKGTKGFGYDPIFIPKGYNKTFGEMNPKKKVLIDHRYNAFLKIKNFFY